MKSFIIILITAILATFVFINQGAYNIAATEKHWNITEKIIAWTRDSSIEAHSKNLHVPEIEEAEILTTGITHYNAMCTICHLAPGQEPTELAIGLYPQAPVFHEIPPITDTEGKLHKIKEYFWAIKNGIKMTAMPAWGPTHDDDSIWAMAAFVHQLHGMTPDQYKEHKNNLDHDHDHGHHHDHHH